MCYCSNARLLSIKSVLPVLNKPGRGGLKLIDSSGTRQYMFQQFYLILQFN